MSFRTAVQRDVEDDRGLQGILADIGHTTLVETLVRCGGDQVATAKGLAIPRQPLRNRLKAYGP